MSAYANVALWKDLALASGVMIAYLLSFQMFGGKDNCMDSPRYTWWNAWTIQMFWFPLFCYFALEEVPGATFVDKCFAPWPQGPREDQWLYGRLWMYVSVVCA